MGDEEDAKREVDMVEKIHAAERLTLQPAQ
jgi:hypothetical protein